MDTGILEWSGEYRSTTSNITEASGRVGVLVLRSDGDEVDVDPDVDEPEVEVKVDRDVDEPEVDILVKPSWVERGVVLGDVGYEGHERELLGVEDWSTSGLLSGGNSPRLKLRSGKS